jgi:DNA repair exonuclease SbcCD nuclease subunit
MSPKAVLISDIHYNIQTLPLADTAMRMAIAKSNELQIPLIVAGDLHDTKANLRGECVNAMLETFKLAEQQVFILRGNHDSINERSTDHSLNFLSPYATIITNKAYEGNLDLYMIAYQHDPDELRKYIKTVPKSAILAVHQGIQGSNSGEYIQDKSAISPEDVAGFRVISGHYHTRQTIALPNAGKWDYIGNPYTLNFAEANDPEKGFQILMDDGSLEFVPTNLRKHVVIEVKHGIATKSTHTINSEDLVWVKVQGTREELANITKHKIAANLQLTQSFRLDLIPTDEATKVVKLEKSQPDTLDNLIANIGGSDEHKARLKQLWRDLCE